jgi:DNA modification methylase
MIKNVEKFADGIVICGDSTSQEVFDLVSHEVGTVHLVLTDPPYGNVIAEDWDKINDSDDVFSDWMKSWTESWSKLLVPNGAFYVWGGLGIPGFRPFFKYLTKVEKQKEFELSTVVTWAKKRAYGTKWGYLFTREELAYFVKGSMKEPRVFNVPLLETKRGYAGYNPKYPAKSEFYRRTNVWTDIIEIMQGKIHPTEKKQRVIEIPIETNTNTGEWVLDMFGGCGTTALACRKLNRRFVVIEEKQEYFQSIVDRLRSSP